MMSDRAQDDEISSRGLASGLKPLTERKLTSRHRCAHTQAAHVILDAGLAIGEKRGGASAASLNGLLYVVGGWLSFGPKPTATALAFDPSRGNWTAIAPVPTARKAALWPREATSTPSAA